VKDFLVWTFYFKKPYEDLSRELSKYHERVKKAEAREEGASEEENDHPKSKNVKIQYTTKVKMN